MAVKRRIVWLGDKEWTDLAQAAARDGQTISAFLRDIIYREAQTTDIVRETPIEKTGRVFGERAVDAENALNDLGDTIRFNTKPFKGPIPKRGR